MTTLLERMVEHEQAPMTLVHHFGPDTYTRELVVPAGAFCVGHHHVAPQMNIFLKGRVVVLEDGVARELVAPMIFVGQAGRKVGFVLEDMVWLNVWANPDDERDIETLEARLVDKTLDWDDDEAVRAIMDYVEARPCLS